MEEIKVGVYVCQCGVNIASVVDVADVVRFARDLPHAVDEAWAATMAIHEMTISTEAASATRRSYCLAINSGRV